MDSKIVRWCCPYSFNLKKDTSGAHIFVNSTAVRWKDIVSMARREVAGLRFEV